MNKVQQDIELHPFIPLNTSLRKKVADTFRLWFYRKRISERLVQGGPFQIKSLTEVYHDMLHIIWRYEIPIKYFFNEYFEERIHLKEHELEQFTTWSEWLRLSSILERENEELSIILNDKNLSWQYFQERGITVTERIGSAWRTGEGDVICRRCDGETLRLEELLSLYEGVFVKPANSCEGQGCAKILLAEKPGGCLANGDFYEWNSLDFFPCKRSEALIIEKLVLSHPSLEAFHPSSLNTLRLVTMRTPNGGLEISQAFLKIGVGTATVDNWCAGGISIKVLSDGTLNDVGVFKSLDKEKCFKHPDSGIIFAGFEVPFYREAVELVLRAHSCCPHMFGIGWDVAITADGPLVVESNVQYAISQPICGGLRPVMDCWLRPVALSAMNHHPHP